MKSWFLLTRIIFQLQSFELKFIQVAYCIYIYILTNKKKYYHYWLKYVISLFPPSTFNHYNFIIFERHIYHQPLQLILLHLDYCCFFECFCKKTFPLIECCQFVLFIIYLFRFSGMPIYCYVLAAGLLFNIMGYMNML